MTSDTPSSTTIRQPRAVRQASLLAAAARAFGRTGYSGTSMDDVAAEAGVTRLIVYRHFAGKEELYRTVLERVSERLRDEFLAGLAGAGPSPALPVRTLLCVAREDPDAFRLLWVHAAREPAFADYATSITDRAVALAMRLFESQPLPVPSTWAAETMAAHVVDAVLRWLDEGDVGDDEAFIELIASGIVGLAAAWLGALPQPPGRPTEP